MSRPSASSYQSAPGRLGLQAEVLFPSSCVPRESMRNLKHQHACVREKPTELLAASWGPIKGHATLSLNTPTLTYKQKTGLLSLSYPSASRRRGDVLVDTSREAHCHRASSSEPRRQEESTGGKVSPTHNSETCLRI